MELLSLEEGEIRVAEYLTAQIPRPLLAARLQAAIRQAREQLAARQSDNTGPDAPDKEPT